MATTVRISEQYRELLKRLADEDSTSQQAVLEKALEQYRRARFLDGLDRDCRENGSLKDEAETLEGTLEDGLD